MMLTHNTKTSICLLICLACFTIQSIANTNPSNVHLFYEQKQKKEAEQKAFNKIVNQLLDPSAISKWNESRQKEKLDQSKSNNLSVALNPDGTLRSGIDGSFNAKGYTMQTGSNGKPVFAYDEAPPTDLANGWENRFGFGNGLSGTVYAIAISGSNIYVGGSFAVADKIKASNIAMWDGTVWNKLGSGSGNGVNGAVYTIAISGSNVYAGGAFNIANDGGTSIAVGYTAVWNGSTWSKVGSGSGNGLDGPVYAIAISGTNIYAGGNFTSANVSGTVVAANRIALWNGASWSKLGSGAGNGLNNTVLAIAITGTDVYVGGEFTIANWGATVSARYIARWDGTNWNKVGTGTGIGMNNFVRALTISGSNVYAGGDFTQANLFGVATPVNYIAVWDGSTWSALKEGSGTGLGSGTNVYSICVIGTDVYAGGNIGEAINNAGSISTWMISKWDGTKWNKVAASGIGLSSYVYALAALGTDLYAAGEFTLANYTGTEIITNKMAKWNNTNWSAIGSNEGYGLNYDVYAITISGNDVYVGGAFHIINTGSGYITAQGIAKWNGTTWSRLATGTGTGLDGHVHAIAVSGSDVYAAGNFLTSYNNGGGVVSTNNIAKWNGTTWSSLGSGGGNGVDSYVYAIAVSGSNVYIGGAFTTANVGGTTVAANYFAVWNGSVWANVGSGSGFDATVKAITIDGSNIYVGGEFTTANVGSPVSANYIALWNGSTWSKLGSGSGNGVDAPVYAIAISGSNVYLGGAFSNANIGGTNVVANSIARWNGTNWSKLGSGSGNGVYGYVYALTIYGNNIFVGGSIALANLSGTQVTANNAAMWDGTAWSSLGTGTANGTNSPVYALGISNNSLKVGGNFTSAGDAASAYFGIYYPPITWTGSTSTDWNTTGNWATAEIPSTTSNVLIPAIGVTNEPTLSNNTSVQNVTIQAGRTLTVSGSNALTVQGPFLSNNATITGAGSVVMAGTLAQQIVGGGTMEKLEINNASGISLPAGEYINLTGTLVPTSGTISTNSNLTFKSTVTSTARVLSRVSGNYISGNVITERYTNDRAVRKSIFLSSPVTATVASSWKQQIYVTGPGTGGTTCTADVNNPSQPTANSNGFDATPNNNGTVFTYNTDNLSGNRWVTIPNTSYSLTPGTGYRVLVRGVRTQGCAALISAATDPQQVTLSATGALAQGNINADIQGSGYTLLGNPYQCEISFAALRTSNNTVIDNKYWTYNTVNASGIYTTWDGADMVNGGTLTNPDRIAIGQSFFVQNTGGADQTVTSFFQETHKTADGATQTGLFRTGNWMGKLRVALKTQTDDHLDETLIRFNDNNSISVSYNNEWDTHSLSEGSYTLSSLKSNGKMAIQTRPSSYVNDTVALNVTATAAGNFKLNFSNFSGISSDILLLDHFTNTVHDVKANPLYSFSVSADAASQGSNRFAVVFKQSSVLPLQFIALSATAKNNGTEITWKVPFENDMQLYDVQRSADGRNFHLQGTVAAIGNSRAALTYSWMDMQPVKDYAFYRIKSVSRNGEIKFSPVVSIKAGDNTPKLITYPNPVLNELNIMLSHIQGQYSINITDAKGISVYQQNKLNAASNIIQVNTTNFSRGIYFIHITSENGQRLSGKFVK